MNYNRIFFFVFILSLASCGFKGPPTPMFPTSGTPIDDEVEFRNQGTNLDQLNIEKEKLENNDGKK